RALRRGMEGLKVYLLVERAAPETEVEALIVSIFHSFHHLLGHPHGKGEVAANLPHHDGGANVFCLDLDVLARHLLRDLQAVGTMLVSPILGAICEGRWELVHLGLVHFLVHAFLEALEDDGELCGGKRVWTGKFTDIAKISVITQLYAFSPLPTHLF
uniref:Uncharacterized protein n=1 Tax=Varanus komodoensis TaxID=61221 RepID=A0A8D2LV06_VARKO